MEHPNTFIDNKSFEDFKCIKQIIEDKKIMKGNNSKIKVGTYDNDKMNGNVNDRFKFLKNSISSNKFKIIPTEIKIKIALKKTLKNFYPKLKKIIYTQKNVLSVNFAIGKMCVKKNGKKIIILIKFVE